MNHDVYKIPSRNSTKSSLTVGQSRAETFDFDVTRHRRRRSGGKMQESNTNTISNYYTVDDRHEIVIHELAE